MQRIEQVETVPPPIDAAHDDEARLWLQADMSEQACERHSRPPGNGGPSLLAAVAT